MMGINWLIIIHNLWMKYLMKLLMRVFNHFTFDTLWSLVNGDKRSKQLHFPVTGQLKAFQPWWWQICLITDWIIRSQSSFMAPLTVTGGSEQDKKAQVRMISPVEGGQEVGKVTDFGQFNCGQSSEDMYWEGLSPPSVPRSHSFLSGRHPSTDTLEKVCVHCAPLALFQLLPLCYM